MREPRVHLVADHEAMADLYLRALSLGFRIERRQDRRGCRVLHGPGAMGDDAEAARVLIALLENEGQMFDFLEASERLAAEVAGEAPVPSSKAFLDPAGQPEAEPEPMMPAGFLALCAAALLVTTSLVCMAFNR